jgi:hypothetical protein
MGKVVCWDGQLRFLTAGRHVSANVTKPEGVPHLKSIGRGFAPSPGMFNFFLFIRELSIRKNTEEKFSLKRKNG